MDKLRSFVIIGNLLGLLLVANAFAGDGDPVAGEQLSQPCAACHGVDGNSVNPIWPKLAGQHAGYTAKQLYDFKSGQRNNAQMTAMVAGLSDRDIEDLAAYYSTQKIVFGEADLALIGLGERLYRAGDKDAGLPACMGCHNPSGRGNPAALYPSLRGQYAAYAVTQLQAFKLEQRDNDDNSVMRYIAARMSNAQMEAVAEYMQGLRAVTAPRTR